jgi:hypothetical protein
MIYWSSSHRQAARTRFRDDLERAKVGPATVRLCMAIVQSVLSFAVREELVEYNTAATVGKPRYVRARDPLRRHQAPPGPVHTAAATARR